MSILFSRAEPTTQMPKPHWSSDLRYAIDELLDLFNAKLVSAEDASSAFSLLWSDQEKFPRAVKDLGVRAAAGVGK